MEEYRRVVNMLRPVDAKSACSGFVKIEQKGATATVTVSLKGMPPDEGALTASLAARDRKSARLLGEMQIDARGQGTLKAELRALDIEGCDAVCVWRVADGRAFIAACASVDAAKDVRQSGLHALLVPPKKAEPQPAPVPVVEETKPVEPAVQEEAAPDPAPAEPEWLWPGTSARVKALFERSSIVHAFEQPHIRFARVPVADAPAGFDHYLLAAVIGQEDGQEVVQAVGYAIPGSYRLTPPPGLEGYLWKASSPERSAGVSEGYWISWQKAGDGGAIRECFRIT